MDSYETPIAPAPQPAPPQPYPAGQSSFDGGTLGLIGWRLLGGLLTAFTLGIGAPWAQCMIYRWETKHTTIGGRRLQFTGTGGQLLGKYLLWGLLTLVTFGIYAMFIPVRMSRWRASHTRFADEQGAYIPKQSSGFPVWAIALIVVGALLFMSLIGLGAAAILGLRTVRNEPAREVHMQENPSYSFLINGNEMIVVPMDSQPVDQSANRPVSQPETFYVNVTDSLSIRSGPGTDYEKVGSLQRGKQVTVEYWEGNWAFIGGGYISGDYLSKEPVEALPAASSDPSVFLSPKAPADGSMAGSWVFAYNLYTVELSVGENHSHCRALRLTLNEDGTFAQNGCNMMLTGGLWHYPGGDEPGPHYVGDYTFDGQTLVLNYKAREYDNYVEVSPAEPPMWVSSEWRAESHQAVLTIGQLNADGSLLSRSVSGTNSLPIYMDSDPAARHGTYLYREAGYESLNLIDYFTKILPMFHSNGS